jgi:hypothetical protein
MKESVRASQVTLGVHGVMQHPNDLDPLRDQHREDRMATFMALAARGTNRIAGTTTVGASASTAKRHAKKQR